VHPRRQRVCHWISENPDQRGASVEFHVCAIITASGAEAGSRGGR
jgi:hypothetical protein